MQASMGIISATPIPVISEPKFKCVFTDMDGTLLNSKSQISSTNKSILIEAVSRGIMVIIATGKTRAAAMRLLNDVDGVVSESSPGVFAQGLMVYGRGGEEIFQRNLDRDICREAFQYSEEHKVPLVAFCQDQCLTLFNHPLVDALHTVYKEPKAETIPDIELLLSTAPIQKLIFVDTVHGVAAETDFAQIGKI